MTPCTLRKEGYALRRDWQARAGGATGRGVFAFVLDDAGVF